MVGDKVSPTILSIPAPGDEQDHLQSRGFRTGSGRPCAELYLHFESSAGCGGNTSPEHQGQSSTAGTPAKRAAKKSIAPRAPSINVVL
jgi:hypothetical protein